MTSGLRIGYSFWGFLGDNKIDFQGNELSTPDGNATYSWSIIWEAIRRGHTVFSMQDDRDRPAVLLYGACNFSSFSQEKRLQSYNQMIKTYGVALPELDVLLVEWRFPIPGRNTPEDRANIGYQHDLERQTELLRFYRDQGTKIIVWDLDHKLTGQDEVTWEFDAVFETSVRPRNLFQKRTRVEPPFVISDLLQFATYDADASKKLVYVGSRYERDDIITEYVRPVSDRWPGHVVFYGNWLKTLDECRSLWPNVLYRDRITTKGFTSAYRDAVACPLLAKRSYLETVFVTPRVWESVLFGTIPIALLVKEDKDQQMSMMEYVQLGACDAKELADIVYWLASSPRDRQFCREATAEKLDFMDARYFVDRIEDVLDV